MQTPFVAIAVKEYCRGQSQENGDFRDLERVEDSVVVFSSGLVYLQESGAVLGWRATFCTTTPPLNELLGVVRRRHNKISAE